jgi:hypothetical protein
VYQQKFSEFLCRASPFVMHAYLGGIARENAMVAIADCRLSSAGAEH